MLRKGKQFGARRVTPVTNPVVSDKIGPNSDYDKRNISRGHL